MYHYVEKAIVSPYRQYCGQTMQQLCHNLKDYGISSTFRIIGSARRSLITQNGDEPFDLDYNLIINEMNVPINEIKDIVMDELNGITDNEWSFCKDSTSSIKIILHYVDSPNVNFSFDVGIIKKNKIGNYCRLLHNKYKGTFQWAELPQSQEVFEKADILKGKYFAELKRVYLYKKNYYLQKEDYTHPSFKIYVESVNEVYSKYFN